MNRENVIKYLNKKPLFNRFLKELSIREDYIRGTLAGKDEEIVDRMFKRLSDENLIIGAFRWGRRESRLTAMTWNKIHKLWNIVMINKTDILKLLETEQLQ